MKSLLARLADWFSRFFACASCLGWRAAVTIFLLSRRSTRLRSIAVPTGRPFFFRGRTDLGVISHFYKPLFRIRDTLARPVRTILDCGANIGDETCRFRFHHSAAEIVAVEPQSDNFEILKRNFADDPQTHLVHGGVWSHTANLKVIAGAGAEDARTEETADAGTDTVAAFGVADLMNGQGWSEIDILKLDIEGSERQLFSSGTEEWISKVNCLVFEIPDRDSPGTSQIIFDALKGLKFNVYSIDECLIFIRRETGWDVEKVVGFAGK